MDTRKYEKIGEYPQNGYPTDMGTGTRRIFIQRIGYGGATTRTLPTLLTSLDLARSRPRPTCINMSLVRIRIVSPQYMLELTSVNRV